MRNRDIVYSSLQVIEDNLKHEINVASVSQGFGFSLYYFSRLFKGVTGYSLKDYILMRKLSEAYQDIVNTDEKIIDIAFSYGFGSPETFSRAFYRTFSVNPSQIRSQKLSVALFPPLTKENIENTACNRQQSPEVVELDEIQLVGIPFYFDLALQNDLSRPWRNLLENTSLIGNRDIPEKFYQVQYWFPEQEADFFYFFIAVQVDKPGSIPIQFTAKTIPAQRYLKFQHRGESNTVGRTYRYIYDTFLPETEYRLPHLYSFEFYGEGFLGPHDANSISDIYIPFEGEPR